MMIIFIILCGLFFFKDTRACEWPVLKSYENEYIQKIAMPVGGIGTGTISLGGRGNFQDLELMNTPAKGYNPGGGLFFTLYTDDGTKKDLRLLEGKIPFYQYEGDRGATAANHGLPRFKEASFSTAYPFGEALLSTPQIPVVVKVKSFNPLIPGDVDNSSIPMAVIDFELTNTSGKEISFSICGTMQNFIGEDGNKGKAKTNKNSFFSKDGLNGILYTSEGVDKGADQWGEMALVCTSTGEISYRLDWLPISWGGTSLLDFWDDLSSDGKLEIREELSSNKPKASLAAGDILPPNGTKTIRFLLTWYFPNRTSWSTQTFRNYYATKYSGAWDVAAQTIPHLKNLEGKTIEFVSSFCKSTLPEEVKEAALFNISTLRTQTCFRHADGNFFAWEGCNDYSGSGYGSCTHVWNYETATAFLFGDLAKTMREVEFSKATSEEGAMSFRVKLPYEEISLFGKTAADGQMGCIMKLYREWQLSGDDSFLKKLYLMAKRAMSYVWARNSWDADRDGVMEGVQHNTMDVEYYGPNPQMTIWYLGALRAMEEMAASIKDMEMAGECRKLYENGSKWTDENLFNGEYYIHRVIIPDQENIREEQKGNKKPIKRENPDFQLGEGCLTDQLVGQYFAHVCGLGYLVKKENVSKTLNSIMQYNYRSDLSNHFNCLRSFALDDESALLMASYPRQRPVNPFPYFTEVMTGFEYTAAVGMLYEGQTEDGLKCIKNIRARYDGRKRNPFNETECGYHYGRAMASWSAILALSGFNYSGVDKSMVFTSRPGIYFWSNGYAWGTCMIENNKATLNVLYGEVELLKFTLSGLGSVKLKDEVIIRADGNKNMTFEI